MLLLIDNYDSFAHNLARYFEQLGQATVAVRNDAIDVDNVRRMRPSAIVISPGPCAPRDAGASLEIVSALSEEIPMLGVCLGHQIIAEALGGKVVRSKLPVHGRTSPIAHLGSDLFAGLPSPLTVGRYHSLVVERASLPEPLRPTAWTPTGEVMAIAHVRLPVYGVQFHPESILTEYGYELLSNFLTLVGLPIERQSRELSDREFRRPIAPRPLLPTSPVTF